jgi:DNA-binding transcriptional LysR family regulator
MLGNVTKDDDDDARDQATNGPGNMSIREKPVMKIKLRQLDHALALSRHGSFRRAASAQHLSQPALSRSIHALEESLGVSLFDREATEVTLTKFGEALLHRAEFIIAATTELEREMTLMKGLVVGEFSVAMGMLAAAMSGTLAVAELLRAHPTLQVNLEMRHWRDVERMVRSGQVDIGFCEIAHLQDSRELNTDVVGRHDVVFYCRTGHPLLDSDRPLTTTDLDEYPFVGAPIPARLAPLFPRNCIIDRKTGDVVPPIMVQDLAAACALVERTDAFGSTMPLQIEPALRSGSIAIVPFQAPWLCTHYGFISLRSRSLSPAAEAFKAIVREIELEVSEQSRSLASTLRGEIEGIA